MYVPAKSWAKKNKMVGREGYILINIPEHPKSFNGWYYEHRLMMEKQYNRILEEWESVHHINEIKTDNRLVNLFLCSIEEHKKAHVA